MALDAGKKAMKEMLTGLIGLIADQAIALGKALLMIGAPLVFTGWGTAEGLKDLAAGTALIVGGGVIKGLAATAFGGSYEKGGLFKGASLIQVGESSKAVKGGGEWVSPIGEGARLMTQEMSRLGAFNYAPTERMDQLQPNGMNVTIGLDGQFRLSGGDYCWLFRGHKATARILVRGKGRFVHF